MPNPFHWQKMREDYFRSRMLSGLLLARLPLGGENCTCANQLRVVGVMWARHWLSSDGISSHKKRRKNVYYEFTFSFAPSRSSREGRPDRREEVWPKTNAGKLWHLSWRYAKLKNHSQIGLVSKGEYGTKTFLKIKQNRWLAKFVKGMLFGCEQPFLWGAFRDIPKNGNGGD